MKKLLIALLLALPIAVFCQEIDNCPQKEEILIVKNKELDIFSKVIDFAKNKLGIGYGRHGFDCSGLVAKAFKSIGIDLPHSSNMQSEFGEKITKNDALPGDLIFFSSPRSKKKVGHVGIITKVAENSLEFIHAAVKGGVRIDKLSEAYYQKHFLLIKRNFFSNQLAENH